MRTIEKISAAVIISRPVNLIITFFSIGVAGIICTKGALDTNRIFLAMVSGMLVAAAGNIINDIFDLEIDMVNKPARPLPQGKLTLSEASIIYAAVSIAAILLSALASINCFIIAVITSALLFLYSYKFKRIILLGNLIIAFITGLAFIYGGTAAGNIEGAFIPAVFAFLINFIRELVKDMEDIKGDLKKNISTFPHRFGYAKTKALIFFTAIVLILLSVCPFILKIYAVEYFLIVMLIVNPILVYFLKSLKSDDSVANLNKLSLLLKLNMVFGLTAIFFGK